MAEYQWYNWTDDNHRQPVPITTDDYKKTQTNFNVDSPKQRQHALETLCKKIQESQIIRGQIKTDDTNLLRFLYCRKFNVPEALKLIENHYNYIQRHPELFQIGSGATLALKDGFPIVLDSRDRRGRCVIVLNASSWDTSNYTLLNVFQALIISLERLTSNSHNQLCGFIFIVDWSEFTLKQSTNLNPRMLKIFVECLEDCYPAKFKGIHFIGQPWYVATALTVIKPFLKEKTRNRIYLHGNNLATLHEYVPIDILPTELGGEGPPLNASSWAEQILESL